MSDEVCVRIQLTLKGVDILVPSFLKWKVQLSPPHTLDTKVSKAASPDRRRKHICQDTLEQNPNKKYVKREKTCMTWKMCGCVERERLKGFDVHLWRRLVWGLNDTTQIPEPSGQSLPTRQWGWGRCGRSLVTKETVTVTLFMWSMEPWIWQREQESEIKEGSRKTVKASSTTEQTSCWYKKRWPYLADH